MIKKDKKSQLFKKRSIKVSVKAQLNECKTERK